MSCTQLSFHCEGSTCELACESANSCGQLHRD
jgi:hypothetical protein